MTIRPMNDRVVVRKLVDAQPTGLIIAVTSDKPPQNRGEVVAVGPGRRGSSGARIPVSVKPGDVVYYGRFWDYDGEDLVMVQEADIIGVEANAA